MKKLAILVVIASAIFLGMRGVSTIVQLEFEDAAALGLIGTKITTVNKFGANNTLTSAEESIWDADDLASAGAGPARCFTNIDVGTPKALFVSSDDATDTGLGISIEVLDGTWARSMITMNLGVTATTTGTVYEPVGSGTVIRVNRAFATGDAFTGNIYIHIDPDTDGGGDGVPDNEGTQTIAVITAGEDQTLQACYTVPLGYSATIKTFLVSNINTSNVRFVTFRLRQSIAGAAARTTNKFALANGTSISDTHNPPMVFAEKTDIELTAIASAGGAQVTGTFDIILFPNSMF